MIMMMTMMMMMVMHRQPKLKLCAMIILRNSGHGANMRVRMAIFMIGFREYKYWKVLNKNDLAFMVYCLLSVCFF